MGSTTNATHLSELERSAIASEANEPLEHLGAGGDELELACAVRRQQAQHRRREEVERLAGDRTGHELLGREGGAETVKDAELVDETRREPVDGIVLTAVERTWEG